jgi:predicted transcriptional regulator
MASVNYNDGPYPQLGPLETHLLGLLCRIKNATVRELLASGEVAAAYTTVMTTLDRLYKKGLLGREADSGQGRAFRYRLKQGQREIYQVVLGSDLTRILRSAADPALPVSFLVDAVAEHDETLLDELRRAVNRKRQELRRRNS